MTLEEIIDKNIKEFGFVFGPALINLLLYSPFEEIKYSQESSDILQKKKVDNRNIYDKVIIPKIGNIIGAISSKECHLAKKANKIYKNLKIEPFEKIRELIFKKYDNQFNLSEPTKNGLKSKKKLIENDYISFYFTNDHLISFRQKKPERIKEKLERKKEKYIDGKLSNLVSQFITEIMDSSNYYWVDFDKFHKKYGDLNEVMLGDEYGIKVIDLNQKRADKRMEELLNYNGNFKINGFNIVNRRIDDHRGRTYFKRPGGIHYTLTDVGFPNFPIEVQYSGIKSFIYDYFGPRAHYFYKNKQK